MTTRNFRVHNGISVGDIAISAANNTITGMSAAAPSADGDAANKKYVDDQAAALLTLTNKTVTNAVLDGTLTGTAIKDEDNMASNSATVVPTQQSVKAYVDSEISSAISSSNTLTSGNTTVVASGTSVVNNVNSTAQLTVTEGAVRVHGNLIVEGTETIINTNNLSIEDAIIGLNANVSDSANMPRFSGMHLHRGNTSGATDLDLYMVWDDATNALGTTTNLGGTFTFMGSVHEDGSEAPNSGAFILADIKASTVEANLTGTATAAEYSDVAERFASDSAYTPGTVVALGGAEEITQVNEEASDEVFGVVSSLQQAAFKMNGGAGNDDTHPYIAMTGRVNVKVIGSVNKGDRLISASVPGYARAATKAECTAFNVIGRALTSKSEAGQGSVLAAVRVSH